MKRKFKIIFAIVAVMAMLFAFAMVSSASVLPDLGGIEELLGDYLYADSYTHLSLIDDNYHVLMYFNMPSYEAEELYNKYGHYSLTVSELNAEMTSGSGSPDSPKSFWYNHVINYQQVLRFFDAGNSYESLGAIYTYGLFDGPYNIYTALQNNKYTQSDLDNAVIEGKEAGVEEYKNSTEYKLELLEEVKKITGGESEGMEIFYDFSSEEDWYFSSFDSVNEINIPYGENKNLYFASFCAQKCGFVVDSSALRDFCSLNNISNFEEFCSFVELEYFNAENFDDLKYPETAETYIGPFQNFKECDIDDLFLEALNYSEFTSDSLDAKYNEGVEAGKAEGKTEGYTEGFAEGMESFKESEAYANALQVQYATGKTDGVTEFKKSVAFKNTLKGEYDNGYDDGVADTEGQAVKNEFTKVLSIFIGVMGFGIILMAVLGVASKFKKKAKRR